jgi:VWFA-related protein
MRNILSVSITSIFSWTFLLLADVSICAQQLEQKAVTINTDLVTTWAQVTNRVDGAPLKGLGLDDFQLREDGKRQQVGLVKEGQPLSVVILVDGMTCVRFPEIEFRRSREALRQLGEDAEIALMAWDSDVRLVQPLTRNQRVIADRMEDRVSFFTALNGTQSGTPIIIRPERDHSRPGEAVYQAAQYLEKAVSPERRKIIIVISQSFLLMAQTHLHTAAEVKTLLRETGVTVYALLENNGMRSDYNYGADKFNPFSLRRAGKINQQRRRGGTLEEFVDLTGGAIFVSKNMPWLNLSSLTPNGEFGKEFDELFIKLTRLIRTSYTIGYYPENTNLDGRFRRIKLELSPTGKTKAGKVNITAREGYYAVRRPSPSAVDINPKQ